MVQHSCQLARREFDVMFSPRGSGVEAVHGPRVRTTLDIGRPDNRHLSFGGGIHYCLGAPLARLEAEIAFQTLTRRLPTLALAADTVTYRDNFVLRGLEALPVTF